MLRRLVVTGVVLLALAGLADRGLARIAGDGAASAVRRSEGLTSKPEVRFRGFPFVTQALRGRFDEVDLAADNLRREGLTITRVEAELRGVGLGFVDALAGRVEEVPVAAGTATVTLSYDDLNDYLRRRAGERQVGARDGRLVVTATISGVATEGTATLRLGPERLRVRVTRASAVGGGALPAAVAALVEGRLSFDVPLTGLPFGLTLREVTVGESALRVSAAATGIVLRAR